MSELERSYERLISRPIRSEILRYGSIGAGSAVVVQFTSGFAVDHPLPLALGVIFWILFSGSMAWTFWEFVLPVAGREGPRER